jgi:BMFP domain-containing protein YqiC
MDRPDIEATLRGLLENLPTSIQGLRAELESHLRRALQAGTQRLDLVSREEFDAQSRVLARSRELIDELEVRVAQLEKQRALRS